MIRSFLTKAASSRKSCNLKSITSSASLDHVNFYRVETTLVLTLPSPLVPNKPSTTSIIKPFVLHPFLNPLFDSFDVQSLKTEQVTERIINIVERYYELKDGEGQFVGSMGENDGGVWFIGDGYYFDALDHWDLIRDITDGVKESRHGIPFGIYSCGRSISNSESEKASLLESELGLSRAEVTLGTGEPSLYGHLVGFNDLFFTKEEFNRTCNFIATATECGGIPISVSVASGKYTSSGIALAKALGASDIRVY